VALTSTELSPRMGSQVDIAKADLLGGACAQEIRALLDQRGILLFRGIHPSDEELRTIARTLGDLRIGASKREADGATLKEGEEGVLKVSLDPEVNPEYAQFLPGNHLWHMDGTYEEVPPLATLFTPFKLSREGGDTLFASTYAAFEDLPEADKQRFEGLKVVHAMQAGLFPAMRDCTPEQFAVWSSYPRRTYPLVWHHKSGRKSLVLSTSAAWVENMHPAESHDLLEHLMRYATQDKYIYRHQWQMGDLVIWDNTGAMHRVMPFDRESGREFHRCTLNGEEPISAAG
jgi:alpha-ketoglutarate-dependent taurine dioxygenase